MADGSVRFIPQTIQSTTYFAVNGSGTVLTPPGPLTTGTYPNLNQNISTNPVAMDVYQQLSTRSGGEAASPP
jgi:hypothetical protein